MGENKIAGFWIRFFGRGIDTILICCITILVALPFMKLGNNVSFTKSWYIYIWSFICIIIWPGYFISLPFLTNGFTIGSYAARIKIKFSNKPLKEIIRRESFFSLLFSLNFFIIMIFINHTLINDFFKMNQKNIKYNAWENFRIAIPTTISSICMLLQMIVGITIIVKKGHGYNDSFSKSQVIYINKFTKKEEIIKYKIAKKYQPKLIEQEAIEWVK